VSNGIGPLRNRHDITALKSFEAEDLMSSTDMNVPAKEMYSSGLGRIFYANESLQYLEKMSHENGNGTHQCCLEKLLV
jgi:hypothetical protein